MQNDVKPVPCLPYDGVKERVEQAEEIFRDIFEFDDIVLIKDQNKSAIIQALE